MIYRKLIYCRTLTTKRWQKPDKMTLILWHHSLIDIFNYLIIQLFHISSMSDILNHLIIQLYVISTMSNIFNYLIIQLFDISSMSDVLNHLIIHLSNVSSVSNIVNYLIIQLYDISPLPSMRYVELTNRSLYSRLPFLYLDLTFERYGGHKWPG